ncbi:MAG: ABC transporter ATP-binding protein [Deltaproteobacteria bacterium]|nr:ABC transporter ATP-binding protein [Deltaproteobacteria bacterium]MBW1816785.1 ABC transporter ATP-binding protein [Deltaproteobacteria bacterium]MBW2284193.1 ABC transporter ATP-binding protein [Deltaproteobacteria bacterium]
MTQEASGDVAVRCTQLHRNYQMGEVTVKVLRGIDLEIRRGELTVIVGASGAGKSTLLNIIGGIDRPTSGEVWVDGENLTVMNDRQLTEYRRRKIGFVFQFYNLVPTLTAVENVQVSTQIASQPMDPAEALKLVDLGEQMHHFPAQLSGGQQQRVSIARALAKQPAIMLCDEPTGALDAHTGQRVLGLLSQLNEEVGATIVIITHAAPMAAMAHRVLHLTMEGITSRENKARKRAEEITW